VSKSEIQPGGVPFALALARKWASLGEREKARELRDRARDSLTRDPQTRPEDLRRFEFQRLQAAVTEGDLDSARAAAATLRALAKEAASEWHQNLAEVLPTKLPPGVTAPALFDLLLSELKLREDLSLSTREQWSLSLAEWMARRGDPKAALAFFESEPSLQSKRATTRHLKADLLKAAGRLPESRALEETLLAEGALHPTRYERVLSDLVTRDRAAGLTAAHRLARSTDDPAVLDWAIEAARSAGQVDEAQRLLERLAVRAPDHPRLKAAAPR
jgi:tetratricopeptide (TPR) repeat protein